MQIVIDIPDYVRGLCCDNNVTAPVDIATLINAVKNGIPLPKGHGRLKDVDHHIKMQWEHPDYSLTDDEPTIIEADTESEDKE